jgi:hypothetical protein
LRLRAVHDPIENRGEDHASERGHDWERCSSEFREFAGVHLATDLEPNHQKEHHHQAFVDGEVERARSDALLPEMAIRGTPRGVAPRDREGRRREQHDAARGLEAEEALDQSADGRLRVPVHDKTRSRMAARPSENLPARRRHPQGD